MLFHLYTDDDEREIEQQPSNALTLARLGLHLCCEGAASMTACSLSACSLRPACATSPPPAAPATAAATASAAAAAAAVSCTSFQCDRGCGLRAGPRHAVLSHGQSAAAGRCTALPASKHCSLNECMQLNAPACHCIISAATEVRENVKPKSPSRAV